MGGLIEIVNEGFQFVHFIFVNNKDYLISITQFTSFYLGRNTHSDQVWMSQPRHVL